MRNPPYTFTLKSASLLWLAVMGAAFLLGLLGCQAVEPESLEPEPPAAKVSTHNWRICVDSAPAYPPPCPSCPQDDPTWWASFAFHPSLDTLELREDTTLCRTWRNVPDTTKVTLAWGSNIDYGLRFEGDDSVSVEIDWDIVYTMHPDSLHRIDDSLTGERNKIEL